MRQNSLIWLFIPVVIGIPISFYAVSLYWEQKFAKLPVYGKEQVIEGKTTDHTVPRFSFTKQDGDISNPDDFTDKIVVANFFFTHCAIVCPKMTNSLKKVQASFSEGEILAKSISVDPERDSVGRLKWYAEKFGVNSANWQLLTGDKKEIYKLARNGFMLVATDGDGGHDDFIHSEKLVLLDGRQRIRGYYDGTSETEVDKLIRDIKKLQNEN